MNHRKEKKRLKAIRKKYLWYFRSVHFKVIDKQCQVLKFASHQEAMKFNRDYILQRSDAMRTQIKVSHENKCRFLFIDGHKPLVDAIEHMYINYICNKI